MQEQENQQQTIPEKYFNAMLIALIIIVALLSIWAFFSTQKQNNSMVYFTSNELPKTTIVGNNLSFSFVIENKEGATIEYSYSILAENETKTKKTVTVADNEKKQITETISFSKPSTEKQKVQVLVEKPGAEKPFEIFFWLTVSK